jgi:hypothetical protein
MPFDRLGTFFKVLLIGKLRDAQNAPEDEKFIHEVWPEFLQQAEKLIRDAKPMMMAARDEGCRKTADDWLAIYDAIQTPHDQRDAFLRKLAEKPEILDKLATRLQSDEIVDG